MKNTRRFVDGRFATPRVVMSACLELEACRYNGQSIPEFFIERLLPHIDLVPICPEVEIGLGVPRASVRLVADGDQTKLVQPATDRDLSEAMHTFSEKFLDGLGPADGFILKSGSPTCGLKGVKVYAAAENAPPTRTEPGMFAGHVLDQYSKLAIESEGRLRNYPIRHHFLTRLYAYAELRQIADAPSVSTLVDFQRRHKHLLMTYDQQRMRQLGRLVANPNDLAPDALYDRYASQFRDALSDVPNRSAYLNSLTHMYGHFKDDLADAERREFHAMLEEYHDHRLPLHAILAVLRSWCSRFEYEYVAEQSLLEPYPRELIQMRDSGKGLDF